LKSCQAVYSALVKEKVGNVVFVIEVSGKNPLLYGGKQQQMQAITCMFSVHKLRIECLPLLLELQ